MHIHSIQISKVKTVSWRGKSIRTGIYKEPVQGPVSVDKLGIKGDEQAEKKHHGTEYMAVYSYASEHYPYWRERLKRDDLVYGIFGENLTTVGLNEDEVCIGDTFAVGSVILQAVQPRYPCFKLGIRMQDDHIIPKFIEAQRPGIYWKVLRPGSFQISDTITALEKNPKQIKLSEIFTMMNTAKPEKHQIDRLLGVDVIDPRWQSKLMTKIEQL